MDKKGILDELAEKIRTHQFEPAREMLADMNPIDIADLFDDLPNDKCLVLFRILPKDLSAEVFSNLPSDIQKSVVEHISDKEIQAIITEMQLDDTVDFIEELPANLVKRILEQASPDIRTQINIFLKYPEDSAGSVMTVEYVALRSYMTIDEALVKYKNLANINNNNDICFIIGETRKLEGVISLKTMVLSDPKAAIVDVMEKNVVSVLATEDQEVVADLFRKYDLNSMPVTDKENRLVGIITVDDIMDVIVAESTEDIHKMAAIDPSKVEYLKESVWSHSKHRITWLVVLMISATFTGMIIHKYEEVLESAVMLAAFIPMLMDTGGNAGAQSSTLVIRGMALGEISSKDFWKVIWKEFRVSLIVGLLLAALNFARVYFFDSVPLNVIFVICISLYVTVILAKVVGSILPMAAKWLKLDPAVMAGPLITTVVDACALMVYFWLSVQLLTDIIHV
ncbi:magnesium transporter [Bacteroides sp.]|uniref:magnesium transporter n=1 Tax=Bacteroides sp. TaxID=29523 RepID=UPI0025909A71|nr:magnesium transporter [Bacteroides sp.]